MRVHGTNVNLLSWQRHKIVNNSHEYDTSANILTTGYPDYDREYHDFYSTQMMERKVNLYFNKKMYNKVL